MPTDSHQRARDIANAIREVRSDLRLAREHKMAFAQVYPTHLALVLEALDESRAAAVRERDVTYIRALCPLCRPQHVLDNGRVWAFCGAQRLVAAEKPPMTEEELAALILSLPAAPREDGPIE